MAALVESSVDIQAPAEKVWRILTDFSSHAEWNPALVVEGGQPAMGQGLTVAMSTGGSGQRQLSPRIVALVPNRELRWRQRWIVPGLLDEAHRFILEQQEEGGVRFRQEYETTGLLAGLMGGDRQALERSMARMNEALKKEAESVRPVV